MARVWDGQSLRFQPSGNQPAGLVVFGSNGAGRMGWGGVLGLVQDVERQLLSHLLFTRVYVLV